MSPLFPGGRLGALICFVVLAAANSLTLAAAQDTREGWGTAGLAVLTYPIIAWLAARQRRIATWAAMVLSIFYAAGLIQGGVGGLSGELPMGPVEAVLRLTGGAALGWAGVTLFLTRHEAVR